LTGQLSVDRVVDALMPKKSSDANGVSFGGEIGDPSIGEGSPCFK
jgi:hypothetical protein